MDSKHGKRQTKVRQKRQNSIIKRDPGSLGAVEAESSKSGNHSIGVGRESSQGADPIRSFSSSRNTITGGMLRQLIDSCKRQKAIKLAEVEELGTQIESLETILADLEQRVRENP